MVIAKLWKQKERRKLKDESKLKSWTFIMDFII